MTFRAIPDTSKQFRAIPDNGSMAPKSNMDFFKPSMPLGMNVATGLMSLMGSNPEQKQMIANLPQAMTGQMPSIPQKLATSFGQNIPSMVGTAPNPLLRIGQGAAMGAASEPENRSMGALSGAGAAAVPETLRFGRDVYRAILPNQFAKSITEKLSKGQSLEENAKSLAESLKESYQGIKQNISNKYNEFFKSNKLGSKELYPEIDKFEKGGRIKVGEPRYYREIPEFPKEGSEEYESTLKEFNKNPTVKNGHELQSQLAAKERELQSNIIKARSKGEPVKGLNSELKDVKKSREKLLNDLHESMGDKADEYKDITSEWLNNVIPYHGNKRLVDIVHGKDTNPTRSTLKNIFSYPENDIKSIVNNLPNKANEDILFQGMGIQPNLATKEDVLKRFKDISSQGYESYMGNDLQRLINELEKASLMRSLAKTTGYGIGAEEFLRRR